MQLRAKRVQLTSSIFRQEISAVPNSGGTRRRDIRDRKSFLTWLMEVRHKIGDPRNKTKPIVSVSEFCQANKLHSRVSAYWSVVRWVAFLNSGLKMHFPTIVIPTLFQELRSCPGSPCPSCGHYDKTLSNGHRRQETWRRRYQYNTGKTLFKCHEPTMVRTLTAHKGQDMSVYFPSSFKIVSLT